jgi:threonine aldolase
MRKAMYNADVGDDVYRDDPTVNELEHTASEMFDKESALFVPSGTFGNQLAILTWTNRGDEIIIGDNCHIFQHEAGGAGLISSVNTSQIPSPRGYMPSQEIENRIRTVDIHHPKTTLICTENAHSSGNVLTLEESKKIYGVASKHNIPVHTDGARFFNAAVYLNTEVSELAKYSDSINICLSKGLCSPVGSLLLGDKAFIENARKYRKILGGGMRQVGVLAAAGLISITKMYKRLHVDHDNAKYLADRLNDFEEITVDYDNLKINMVFYSFNNKPKIEKILHSELKNRGFLVNPLEKGKGRLALHNDVDKNDVDKLVEAFNDILKIKKI